MGDGIIMASKREIAQAETDREWWQAVGEPCGWRIYGWSYRDTAHFIDSRGQLVVLTGDQRNDIAAAITAPPAPAGSAAAARRA